MQLLWNEPIIRRVLSTVAILVLGILTVRIAMRLLTRALERSRLEGDTVVVKAHAYARSVEIQCALN